MKILITSFALACLASVSMAGDTTQSSLTIGGPKSCSSEGFNDPGLLSDGLTEASATLDFTLDTGAGTLDVVVNNTSPVLVGVPNPLITDVYFNAPMAVTGMNLSSQTSSAGPNPAFDLTFDSDLLTNPNPNGANGFGAFSVELSNPMGITGSIQNPLADTVSNPGTHAIAPVTFSFTLAGNLAGVTAADFTGMFSVIPPGNKPTHAVCKFQAGGVAEASAFISDAPEECFLVIGTSFGSDIFTNPGPSTAIDFETSVGGLTQAFGASIENPPTISLATIGISNRSSGPGRGFTASGAFQGQQVKNYWIQVLMWNPVDFPGNPKQWSNGLLVTVWPGGAVTSTAYGSANGMAVTHQIFRGPNGGKYLKFPFLIDDL